MASASFRDSMNSLGWSRREEPAPINTAPPSFLGRIQNLNPFGEGGYVRLPITETNPGAPLPAPSRREEEEGWFACKSTSSITYRGKTLSPCTSTFLTRLVRSSRLARSSRLHSALPYTLLPPIHYMPAHYKTPAVARDVIRRRRSETSLTAQPWFFVFRPWKSYGILEMSICPVVENIHNSSHERVICPSICLCTNPAAQRPAM
jgi:hypothetical protein